MPGVVAQCYRLRQVMDLALRKRSLRKEAMELSMQGTSRP
jgi:hypothetical protein